MSARSRPTSEKPAGNSAEPFLETRPCDDCGTVPRRNFLKSVGVSALAGLAFPALSRGLFAAPSAESAAETTVGEFYKSLSDEQKKTVVFPFDHELRKRINANWQVTKVKIGSDFYTARQQALIGEIVRKVTTEEGYKRFEHQMHDDSGGIEDYSVAVFGTPGSDKFQWELTGRHLTLRADGNSVDKAAFGGPIVYGHGEENPAENIYHYQTKKVNEVFQALDAKQAEVALLQKAPSETAVLIQGEAGRFPGLAVSEMSADQKTLVEATLKTLLAPYRKEDVDEVFEILKAAGGMDKLHLAFYQQDDLKSDKTWDIWRVEGPAFVWHFRGAPHVHAYINIGAMQV